MQQMLGTTIILVRREGPIAVGHEGFAGRHFFSFNASEQSGKKQVVDMEYVEQNLMALVKNEDLSRCIDRGERCLNINQ